MKKMEAAGCSSTQVRQATAAAGATYVKELVPILRRIHGLKHPLSRRGLSMRDKAKLVRLAADLCLVKAAGGKAKWGKALYKRALGNRNTQATGARSTSFGRHIDGHVHTSNGGQHVEPSNGRHVGGVDAINGQHVEPRNGRHVSGVDASNGQHVNVAIGRCHFNDRLFDGVDTSNRLHHAHGNARKTFSMPNLQGTCDRYMRPKGYRGTGINCDGYLSAKHTCEYGYLIARILGLCYRYQNAQVSSISSHCTSLHRLHRRAHTRGAHHGFQPFHIKNSFKSKCRCSRPQHALMVRHVTTQSSRIRKKYNVERPTISSTTFRSRDDHPYNVQHDMAAGGRIEFLQKLIPGGKSLMDQASLFEETALYILALQMQVHSLSALATISIMPTHTTPSTPKNLS